MGAAGVPPTDDARFGVADARTVANQADRQDDQIPFILLSCQKALRFRLGAWVLLTRMNHKTLMETEAGRMEYPAPLPRQQVRAESPATGPRRLVWALPLTW